MIRLPPPRPKTRYASTLYDGRELGRDDPVWKCYVEEAEKWDSTLVDGWNKSAYAYILHGLYRLLIDFIKGEWTFYYAALFSTIVTSFVIESYKNLRKDSAEVTAEAVTQIVGLLQTIATGESPIPRNSTSLPDIFHPTSTAIVVNVTWFLSLSLSVLVALAAMLVKQWGEGYQAGRGLIPPYIQARIRQSRFDRLDGWRTEDIVLVLPVIMHMALGLFLLGLLVFLWDLNHTVALPVVVVVAVILIGYGLTTFLPLFVAFCPYNTPLTSRIIWGYLCQLFVDLTDSEDTMPATPCQREEKKISESSVPDGVTGRAINWLIKHSQEETRVDVAIRAIAGADLPKIVWDQLAGDPLLVLVAQKFTALFGGALDQKIITLGLADKSLAVVSMYGRALTNIAKHRHTLDAEINSNLSHSNAPNVLLTLDQAQAVTRGLHYLAINTSPDIAAFGLTGVSAWYMFTGQPRTHWKETLVRSFGIILEHAKGKGRVRPDALAGLTHSLPIEISYWKQSLSRAEKRELLLPLVELLNRDQQVDEVQGGIPLILAVLAISVNDYPDLRSIEDVRQWELNYVDYRSLVATHVEAAVTWNRAPADRDSDFPTHHDAANRAGWRAWRAQQAARIYTMYPSLRKDHSESLLLLGLAGLLDSLGGLGLEDKSSDIASAVTRQLSGMSILNKSRSFDLPLVLPAVFDIRGYAVDCVTRALRPSRYRAQLDPLGDTERAKLLAAFSEKHRLWVDFGAQLARSVMEMLHLTDDPQLQAQCLIAIEEYSLTNPAPGEWQLFFSYEIPSKLISIAKSDLGLRSRAISNFELFSQHLETLDPTDAEISIINMLRSLILEDLFETLVTGFVCKADSGGKMWKDAILELPKLLKSVTPASENDQKSLALLAEFCEQSFVAPEVNRLVAQLKDKLEE
ncbi:hypothetical protein FRC10_004218 [Ceratobasidium sp. 414]|nr:hypothetical protein FRC10_004218 [Ceratobasidium sp. 414]